MDIFNTCQEEGNDNGNSCYDQRYKATLEECGQTLGFPFFIDEDGPHCGWEGNPDYQNGEINYTDRCQAYACQIAQQFMYEVFDGIGCNLTEFFYNNRHNYLVYAKHPNMTNGDVYG